MCHVIKGNNGVYINNDKLFWGIKEFSEDEYGLTGYYNGKPYHKIGFWENGWLIEDGYTKQSCLFQVPTQSEYLSIKTEIMAGIHIWPIAKDTIKKVLKHYDDCLFALVGFHEDSALFYDGFVVSASSIYLPKYYPDSLIEILKKEIDFIGPNLNGEFIEKLQESHSLIREILTGIY